MNTETGQIYQTPETIAAAEARGEPLVRVSSRVVRLIELGRAAEARVRAAASRKRKRRQERADRKRTKQARRR